MTGEGSGECGVGFAMGETIGKSRSRRIKLLFGVPAFEGGGAFVSASGG